MEPKKSYTIKPYALILGGSSGLGWASAQKLAQEGYALWILHRDRGTERENLEKKFAELRQHCPELITQNTDAIHPQKMVKAIEETLSKNPQIKVRFLLFSIAKGNVKHLIDQDSLTPADLAVTAEAMAFSLMRWVQELDKRNLWTSPASVLAFTSEGGRRAWPGYAAVGAAKAALESLVRSMALEYAPKGIRFNCLQAGVTETPSSALIPGIEELKRESERRNPYQRLTTPEDVAKVVSLLARDEALWINGAIIPVDGGESIR